MRDGEVPPERVSIPKQAVPRCSFLASGSKFAALSGIAVLNETHFLPPASAQLFSNHCNRCNYTVGALEMGDGNGQALVGTRWALGWARARLSQGTAGVCAGTSSFPVSPSCLLGPELGLGTPTSCCGLVVNICLPPPARAICPAEGK